MQRTLRQGVCISLCVIVATIAFKVNDAFAQTNLLNAMFVVSESSPDIVVIDMQNDEIDGMLTLPFVPDMVVASEAQKKLVAASESHRELLLASIDSRALEARIELAIEPQMMQLGANGRLVAIGNREHGLVELIDIERNRKLHQFSGLRDPEYLVFDRDDETLYIVDQSGSTVSVANLQSYEIINEISLSSKGLVKTGEITGFAKTTGGQLGFVTHGKQGRMSVIDLKHNSLLDSVELKGPAMRAYPTGNNQYLIMPNGEDGYISLISTWSMKEVARIRGLHGVNSLASTLLDKVVFVTSDTEDKVLAFNPDSRQILKTFDLDGRPMDSAISPDGTKLYVALNGSGRVAVIDVLQLRVIDVIDDVGERPIDLVTVRNSSYCH